MTSNESSVTKFLPHGAYSLDKFPYRLIKRLICCEFELEETFATGREGSADFEDFLPGRLPWHSISFLFNLLEGFLSRAAKLELDDIDIFVGFNHQIRILL